MEDMIVYRLGESCDLEEVEEGKTYLGWVQGFAPFGIFVQLNNRIKGLVHKSNVKMQHSERDPIIVRVIQIRSNGNIDLEEVTPTVYQTRNVTKKTAGVLLSNIGKKIGRTVMIEGEIAQIKQTSGPTIFTIVDESSTGNAAAFIEAGVRAYPEVELGDIVALTGEVMQRNNQLQIEVASMMVLESEDAARVRERIDAALDERAEPPDIPFLVESEVLEALRPQMRQVAREIRKAVLTSRPIILRHHADADGICAAVAIEQAVTSLIRESGGDFDAEYFLFKRSPSKAPFYEIEDVTRDLDFALKDHARYGQKMPMILLMDNGSTDEDIPSLKVTRIYDLPVMVVDHHHPDRSVDEYLIGHVNPYHVGGDYGITAGMLGTEIARLVNPAVEDQIRHLPAIAAVGDRSEAPERDRYLALVASEYSEDDCRDIALALDYEQFWLRFSDGREIVKDILNLGGDPVRHEKLVDLLVEEANRAIEEQMEAIMPHIESRVLPNGVHLFMLDVELFAHRFTFPPPGKTAGEVHDRLIRDLPGEPVVTLGFGPDFVVLRSRGVMMNIPRMVRELRTEIVGGGVSGGGHLVVGSIKFVEGMRDAVLESLIQKIGEAPI
ncbi:MAG TPA: DHH family phosphoesterase [Candidatus Methanoculleus thermohydrogenotrophicum]|jgi:RecJ-like exonuclease|nr:DHH family phosphoesterase [Candidatus Methanoculleus thermohydrogenotrophicum]HOB18570.1 DHH family phosphoesterase [Candidatus Methanoculleus thermohydrogenotrophicum]HPZ38710.1 DHH family phosphoesterase [Candidatus Methanoculleus thermohydrogenotrophicum]HQC91884.1 DHH family phosphoesterase [Candidatus Methanoculleus thermohydrogenotrophicum]